MTTPVWLSLPGGATIDARAVIAVEPYEGGPDSQVGLAGGITVYAAAPASAVLAVIGVALNGGAAR